MEYARGIGGAKNPEIPEQHILNYGSRVGKIWKLKIKLQIKRSEKRYKFSIVYCFFSDLTRCISLYLMTTQTKIKMKQIGQNSQFAQFLLHN